METVFVDLGKDSYTIHIGSGLLKKPDFISALIPKKQVCIVTDAVVADWYLPPLIASLGEDDQREVITVILANGEANKNQAALDSIYDRLIDHHFSRDCLLVALGGGIVGDITGFAAASYQRGVDFIQIPTTLLAQVDSSVGGKTGINHRLGKNLIGAFHQPKAVCIDTDVLQSLPPREISAGMAEVIKYGLIRDRDFLTYLHQHLDDIMRLDGRYLPEVIRRACQHKANVVENDEKEKGERALLNLGHTFGHAIETLTHYQIYLHGEAVAIGTMMALALSKTLGGLQEDDLRFAQRLFQRANCPVALSAALTPSEIRQAMQRDKKVLGGRLKLVLLSALGEAVVRDDIDEPLILQAIAQCSSTR